MRSEMLVDTPLTFSTIQKNNIPMFCSIFYSLWPSEKLGGTRLQGREGHQVKSLHSQLVLLRSSLLCKQHGASIVITTVSRELFTAKHFCIYLNGASQMGSLILRLSYWQLRSCVWCGWSWDRDLLRGRDSGGWSWDGDLDNEPFLSFPPDAPEDKSSLAPRTAPREQRKQKRSHQFRSSLIPKIVELFIQHWHRV